MSSAMHRSLQPLLAQYTETFPHRWIQRGFNKCREEGDDFTPYSSEMFHRLKLWPNLFSTNKDHQQGKTLVNSGDALEAIWINQHPANCSAAKFIVSPGYNTGFAGRIHVEAWRLAFAMQLGRVYLEHPSGDWILWETNNPFCRNQSGFAASHTLQCYYQPWSNCTIEHALLGTTHKGVDDLPIIDPIRQLSIAFLNETLRHHTIAALDHMKAFVLTYDFPKSFHRTQMIPHVPFAIKSLISGCSTSETSFIYWRTVATTYLLRPSTAALMALQQLKTFSTIDNLTLSVYVRHGDKGVEMTLLDFSAYAKYSEQAIKNYSITTGKEIRSVFIGTEDAKVLPEAIRWAQQQNLTLLYTEVYDRNIYNARQDAVKHHDYEYLSMMLNLEYSLQSHIWLCTLPSNWCQAVDELRQTVGTKASISFPFIDIAKQSCSEPPCVH